MLPSQARWCHGSQYRSITLRNRKVWVWKQEIKQTWGICLGIENRRGCFWHLERTRRKLKRSLPCFWRNCQTTSLAYNTVIRKLHGGLEVTRIGWVQGKWDPLPRAAVSSVPTGDGASEKDGLPGSAQHLQSMELSQALSIRGSALLWTVHSWMFPSFLGTSSYVIYGVL